MLSYWQGIVRLEKLNLLGKDQSTVAVKATFIVDRSYWRHIIKNQKCLAKHIDEIPSFVQDIDLFLRVVCYR